MPRHTALPHAHEAFVVVDPVQDYEETMVILGIYSTLEAAKVATRAHRARPYADGGQYEYAPWRVTRIEHRAGDVVLAAWEFDPERGTWQEVAP